MTTWGLIVEETLGGSNDKYQETTVLAQVDGTREEALAQLERRARRYVPRHPWNARRRRLFRHSDGFLLVVEGSLHDFGTRFTVAELLEDSEAPPSPAPDATPVSDTTPSPAAAPAPAEEPADAPPPRPAPPAGTARDADGIPVKPAWLGRTDLA
ncbi:hypothetical protein [Streptomyces orinoci]|uniref:Uncharacterized protein n=1 Tax=Streptomyces orinoci TaxID=67339 RepID=A0ABV3JVG2_STRON|nr:hypothetical protein [Streptomyces orinoci]